MSECLRIVDYNYVFDSSVDLIASTADSEFPVTNLKRFQRAKVWRTTSVSAQSVVIDLMTAESIDTFVMVFDPLNSPTFSTGTIVRLQASATNVWTSPVFNQLASLDEANGIISLFLTTSQEYRYWRIYIDDPTSTLTYFEVSKIFLGLTTAISQSPSIGFMVKETDQSKIIGNEYGHEYADNYPGRRQMGFDYKAITDADRALFSEIYKRLGRTKPLLVALDPTQSTFLDKDDYILYSFIENEYDASQVFHTFFDLNLELREAM